MERCTFQRGEFLCKNGDEADKLFLIQSGIVEVASLYDKRREDQYFTIERLGKGAIINHRSFMVKDDADTDFVCKTTVSVYVLPTDHLREVESKRQDLLKER